MKRHCIDFLREAVELLASRADPYTRRFVREATAFLRRAKRAESIDSRLPSGKTIREIALEHKDADARCGRSWQCACGACRKARAMMSK